MDPYSNTVTPLSSQPASKEESNHISILKQNKLTIDTREVENNIIRSVRLRNGEDVISFSGTKFGKDYLKALEIPHVFKQMNLTTKHSGINGSELTIKKSEDTTDEST